MIALRVLGPLELRDGTGNVVHTLLAQPKRIALLTFLCVRSMGTFERRDVLTALFWPEQDHQRARASLRTAIHALRRSLGEAITARGLEEVGVAAGAVDCDAVELDAASRRGAWRAVAGLYRGEFLAGLHVHDGSVALEEWIDQQRRRCLHLAVDATVKLSWEDERAGRLDDALAHARRSVLLAPTDEPGVRNLVRLLARAGDRAGAIAAFERLRSTLRQDFDVDPSAETLAVMEEAKCRAPAVASSSPSPAPAPRAEWRLTRWVHERPALVTSIGVAMLLVSTGALWSASQRTRAMDVPGSGDVSDVTSRLRGFLRLPPMPAPVAHGATAYDAQHERAYLFGGLGSGHTNDVWMIDAPGSVGHMTWTRLAPSGAAPAPRFGQTAVYDSITDRLLVFGGALGSSSPCANDLWALESPSLRHGDPRWTEIKASGPPPRADHTATLVGHRRMVVFGGHDCVAQRRNDTWALELGEAPTPRPVWHRIAAGSDIPSPRANHTAVYDGVRDRIILFGGGTDFVTYDDVWELTPASSDTARWRKVHLAGADRPALYAHSAVWDDVTGQMIVFGGIAVPARSPGNRHLPADGYVSNVVWMLRDAGRGTMRWHRWVARGPIPSPRFSHGALYRPDQDQLVVFGGQSDAAVLFDAWVLLNATERRAGPR